MLGIRGPQNSADILNHMDEDIKLMKQLRLKTYSMTISWARLFRNGFGDTSDPDPEVVQLYRTYIQKIVDAGITPIVGLYNWDLPRNVSREFGGWTVQGLKIGVVVYRDERGPGSGSQNPKNFKKKSGIQKKKILNPEPYPEPRFPGRIGKPSPEFLRLRL